MQQNAGWIVRSGDAKLKRMTFACDGTMTRTGVYCSKRKDKTKEALDMRAVIMAVLGVLAVGLFPLFIIGKLIYRLTKQSVRI